MRILFKYIPIIMVLITTFSCNRPKTIPDSTLREMIKEIYLTNAYVQTSTINVRADSLDIYRPILRKYGYNIKDLRHTFANFSKRKSNRISDVVNQAVAELEREEEYLKKRVATIDSVGSRVQRMYTEVIMRDSSIYVDKGRDTSKLRLSIPVIEGIYSVSYRYFIDSLDKNRGLKTTFSLKDNNGKITNTYTGWMSVNREQTYNTKIDSKDTDSTLQIIFGNYPTKELKTPNIRIDSLKIVYSPTIEAALDSVRRDVFSYSAVVKENYYGIEKNSVPFYLYSPGISEQGDDNP